MAGSSCLVLGRGAVALSTAVALSLFRAPVSGWYRTWSDGPACFNFWVVRTSRQWEGCS